MNFVDGSWSPIFSFLNIVVMNGPAVGLVKTLVTSSKAHRRSLAVLQRIFIVCWKYLEDKEGGNVSQGERCGVWNKYVGREGLIKGPYGI